jgi:hypothetical protein
VILCDTGPLVAAFNAADRDHGRCTEFLRENWSRLVVPSLAVTEVCHLLADPQRRGRPALAAEFCAAIAEDEVRVIEAHNGWRKRNRQVLYRFWPSMKTSTLAVGSVASAATAGSGIWVVKQTGGDKKPRSSNGKPGPVKLHRVIALAGQVLQSTVTDSERCGHGSGDDHPGSEMWRR